MRMNVKKPIAVMLSVLMLLTMLSVGFMVPAAAADSLTFTVPECIYLTPSSASATSDVAGQYYLNSGLAGVQTAGSLAFGCPGAENITISAEFSTGGSVENLTTEGNTSIIDDDFTVTANNRNGLITWTAAYTKGGKERMVKNYTYVYKPLDTPTGTGIQTMAWGNDDNCYASYVTVLWGLHASESGAYSCNNAFKLGGSGLFAANDVTPSNAGMISSGSGGNYSDEKYFNADLGLSHNKSVSSPVATLYVDASRFTNLNQIPHLRYGLTCSEDTRCEYVQWTIYHETSDGTQLSQVAYERMYRDCSAGPVWTYNSNITVNYLTSNIAAGETGEYRIEARTVGCGRSGCGDTYSSCYIPFNVVNNDKSDLRTVFNDAVAAADLRQKGNYTAESWAAYKLAYETAGETLGNPVKTYAQVTDAASALETATQNLKTRITVDANDGVAAADTVDVTIGGNEFVEMPTDAVDISREGYDFLGWDKDTVTFNDTVTARWATKERTYTVEEYKMKTDGTWNDYPDTITEQTAEYGTDVYHADLANAPTWFTYNSGKSGLKTTIPAEGSAVIKLYYDREKITVTFKNSDGTVIDTQQVYYGANANTPTVDQYKLKDFNQHYRFSAWSPSNYNPVTSGPLVVTAQYIPEDHNWGLQNWTRPATCTDGGMYTVTCASCGQNKTVTPSSSGHDLRYDDNGNGKHTVYCTKGDYTAIEPHTFVDGVCVCGAQESTGVTVVFKNFDGDVIQTIENVPYGSTPTYTGGAAALKRESTAAVTYEFDKWVQEDDPTALLGAVYADTVYVPVYTENARTYTVVFLNWDGTVLGTEEIAYGESAAALAPTPARADASHTYEFTGWSADITNITKNTYAVAQFEAQDVTNFTVTFTDGDGNTLYTTKVADGEAAVYPMDDPEKEGSTFYGWDKDFGRVTADLTVNALFLPDSGDMVGVTFVNYDNTFLQADVIAKGGTAVFGLADPEKPEDADNTYTFSGWDNDLTNVQANTVFTAQFTAVPKHTHAYTYVPEQAAKCGVAGVEAHYTCDCGKIFDAEYNETDLFDLVIPALEHLWGDTDYNWNADHTACTAKRTCTRENCTAEETANAVVTYEATNPACGVPGNTAYTAAFEEDWAETQTVNVPITALEHLWGDIEYNWNADHTACTATRACTRENCTAEETANAEVTYETTNPACGVPGNTAYTAAFEEDWAETQTANVPIEALEHLWGDIEYNWNADHTACTAKRTCTRDNCGAEETANAEVTSATTAPACGVPGNTAYTATFEEEWAETQTENVPITALEHLWGDIEYSWNTDHTACTAKRTCTRDNCGAEETANATVTSATTNPACGVPGNTAYTATFEEEWAETQTENVPIEALAHVWGEPTYTWSADNAKCTAERLCTREGCDGKETETVNAARNVTTEPKCCVEGEATFTATFTSPEFAEQTTTGEVPALEHLWGDIEYNWNADHIACTATRACTRDNCDGEEIANATVTSATTDPACGVPGNTAYTATFEEEWAETQTENVPITALAHVWGDPTYTWGEGNAKCTAERLCTREGCTGKETETVNAAKNVTTQPGCLTEGEADFTATFDNEAFETQTTTGPVAALGHSWGEWITVTAPTDTENGLAKRTCLRCGAEETKVIPADGEIVYKYVKFVNVSHMHYVIDDEGGQLYNVYNSSTVEWVSARPLRFKVARYSNSPYDDVIIYANGTELAKDTDGWYTLPKNADSVTITAVGVYNDPSSSAGKSSLWDILLRLIQRIISIFKAIMK
ncbi:MAG: FIVAR domain-containing protein [Clostridia bacterium]|nr:FIVAR domain-containing protein [Clostridia bacterium]